MLTCSLMLWHRLHGAGAMPGGAAFALQIQLYADTTYTERGRVQQAG